MPSGRHPVCKWPRETSPGESTEVGAFFQEFPVTLPGQAPTKKQRREKGFSADRALYDSWRIHQRKLIRTHLLSYWTRQKPSVHTVQGYIRSSGWNSNCVSAREVVEGWTLPPKVDLRKDSDLIGHIKQHSWPRLTIAESKMPRAGNGVFATKDFARNTVVCDYNGPVVGAEEGRRVLEALQPSEGSYIFFFKAGEQKLCVNSQVAPCQCHPDKATYGRMINHSTKKLNVKWMVFNVPGEALPVLLIKAARDKGW
ncbi:uncharacterized protein LOC110367969 isoform X5 [Fundulus heteroclitus]|uniref:uncharacterized protein LOC110367969 isoform X5 n=1 Tax=Fundulus heteroclitus TaxID=8078 RepID=UPI00165CE4BB|nr:uncharacterized protein LOC110367969 isoform X5 [Fundulus heteroclitus]XP_035989608.1 uncharacterized protein LOC110367969 isoform X5 [Fundulus heteroclitus]